MYYRQKHKLYKSNFRKVQAEVQGIQRFRRTMYHEILVDMHMISIIEEDENGDPLEIFLQVFKIIESARTYIEIEAYKEMILFTNIVYKYKKFTFVLFRNGMKNQYPILQFLNMTIHNL